MKKDVKIFLNGKLIPASKAMVSVRDHGFLYGDGVYETLRVYNGKIFLLENHLKRLAHSLKGIRLSSPLPLNKIGDAIQKTVQTNKHFDGVVRLTVTRGPGPYGFDIRPCKKPTMAIESYAFQPYPPEFHRKGITAAVVGTRRNSPSSLPPTIKSTSTLNGVLSKMQSIALGASEGIILALNGNVAEGTVSNVFLVKKGVVVTPALDGHLLPGVTRGHVIELAKEIGFKVQERPVPASDLMKAEEIFLTNTTMEVLPVSRLAGAGFKRALPVGPVTRVLMRAFKLSLRRLGYA